MKTTGLLAACWAAVLLLASVAAAQAGGGAEETLYNGIVLDTAWPRTPPPSHWPAGFFEIQASRKGPIPAPPYLVKPPAVVPIDVGRQLLVDDFLVESTTLKRTFHLPEYYPGNPVFSQMPYSGGVWYDPKDKLFKMWFNSRGLALTTSKDGVNWGPPVPVMTDPTLHSSVVWLDLDEQDPAKRYKTIYSASPWHYYLRCSADGVQWGDRADLTPNSFEIGDRSTAYYNPFRKVWVFSTRHAWSQPRQRRYWEVKDLLRGPYWGKTDADRSPIWIGADAADAQDPDMKVPCQLYNLDAIGYESLMLGFLTIWRGDYGDERIKNMSERGKDLLLMRRPKINEVCLGFSRDGWHWSRPDRRPFCPVSEQDDAWNWGNVQSVGGGVIVVGDRLYIYVSGRSRWKNEAGLAVLRRDGFASMDAAAEGGLLTTRAVRFTGKHLFVNVDAQAGELRAEVLDQAGAVIAPFSADRCKAVSVNKTLQAVTWENVDGLAAVAGKPVKFRFHLKNGRLYAFWVSPEASGASRGYVGACGPGFTASTDTAGIAAYRAADPAPAAGCAAAPRIWPLDGTFSNSVKVTIEVPYSLSAPGAVIRYTTDGSDPTAVSPLYKGPFVLAKTATVKARTFQDGLQASPTATAQLTVAPDTKPPMRYKGVPAGTLPAGTTQATLSLKTAEKALCKYATKPGVPFADMPDAMTTTNGTEHSAVLNGLRDGDVHAFFVKARDESGNASGDDFEIRFMVGAAAKAAPVRIEAEAESGNEAAPMTLGADADASGGKYVSSPVAERGAAAIPFSVPAADEYWIWARVIGPAVQEDSFYVAVDGGGEDIFDINEKIKPEDGKKWHWSAVNGHDGFTLLSHDKRTFPLAKGQHVLNVRSREANARLDKLIITNDPALVP